MEFFLGKKKPLSVSLLASQLVPNVTSNYNVQLQSKITFSFDNFCEAIRINTVAIINTNQKTCV